MTQASLRADEIDQREPRHSNGLLFTFSAGVYTGHEAGKLKYKHRQRRSIDENRQLTEYMAGDHTLQEC